MTYCTYCGEKIEDGANFCYACGKPVDWSDRTDNKKQEYAGKLVKCPNCGETLESFRLRCPSCGYEIRKAQSVSSIKELSKKLEAIEAQRPKSRKSLFSSSGIQDTDEQKISLIKNFPIPNTREDILEFLNFAAANSSIHIGMTAGQIEIANVWSERFKYAYEKAKLIIGDSPELSKVKSFYDSQLIANKKEKRREKKSEWFVSTLVIGMLILMVVGIYSLVQRTVEAREQEIKAENIRLEALVEEIKSCIDNGDYLTAKIKLAALEYMGPTEEKYTEYKEMWTNIKAELEEALEAATMENQDNSSDKQQQGETPQEVVTDDDDIRQEENSDKSDNEIVEDAA